MNGLKRQLYPNVYLTAGVVCINPEVKPASQHSERSVNSELSPGCIYGEIYAPSELEYLRRCSTSRNTESKRIPSGSVDISTARRGAEYSNALLAVELCNSIVAAYTRLHKMAGPAVVSPSRAFQALMTP